MKKSLISLGILAVTGCAPPPMTKVDVAAISRGGSFDLTQCQSGFVVDPAIDARTMDAPLALGVCGEFNSDNTSTIAGDVRVKAAMRVSAPVQISGDLAVGAALVCPNTLEVGGDLSAGAAWVVSAPARVGGNAVVQGALHHDNTVQVDGTLTATQENGAGALVTGQTIIDHVNVPAPLDCNAAPDVHAIASVLTDERLDALGVEQPATVDLGCGAYGFAAMDVNNRLTINITGPTRIFVRGRMHVAAPTVIRTAPGAWLELIVDGDLEVDNTLDVSGAVVAVSGNVRIAAPTHLDGVLIAPRSNVAADNTLDLSGSALVGSLRVAAPLHVTPGPLMTSEGWPAAQ